MFSELESEKLPPIDQHPEIEGPKTGQQLNVEHESQPGPSGQAEKKEANPTATNEELKQPPEKRTPRKRKK
jgi:hypothetical protein